MLTPSPARPAATPSPPNTRAEMWVQASVAATFVVIAPFATYALFKEMTHADHAHGPTYSHMRIRRKAFPWKEGDCTMFDLDCKAAARAGKSTSPAHH